MSKKGITPIIATVILLMMTVAAAGAAYLWMTNLQGLIQTEVEGTATFVTSQSALQFDVVHRRCIAYSSPSTPNIIEAVLLNSGTKDIDSGTVGITIRDEEGNDLAFQSNDTMMEDYLNSVGHSSFGIDTYLSLIWDVSEWTAFLQITEGTDYILYLSLPGGVSGTTKCTGVTES